MNQNQSQRQSQLMEFNHWQDLGFSLEITNDGSPTLRLMNQYQVDSNKTESMHHSGGAFSESLYIYGEVIDEAMKKLRSKNQMIKIVSLGLGLGYNELLVAAFSLKYELTKSIQLTSYEVVDGLKSFFVDLCFQRKLPNEIQKTYDLMIDFYEKKFNLTSESLLSELKNLFENNQWIIFSDFFQQTLKSESHVILYDAFSGKTNQELWSEDFLTEKLSLLSADDSLFATYACRASLKNALKKTNYDLVIREGFQGKRNSTQGRRGIFLR